MVKDCIPGFAELTHGDIYINTIQNLPNHIKCFSSYIFHRNLSIQKVSVFLHIFIVLVSISQFLN